MIVTILSCCINVKPLEDYNNSSADEDNQNVLLNTSKRYTQRTLEEVLILQQAV